MNIIFWSSTFVIIYTYLLYPIVVYILSKNSVKTQNIFATEYTQPVSILLVVFNEEKNIQRRINNLLAQQPNTVIKEIIIVSDGSTDQTNNIVHANIKSTSAKIKLIVSEKNDGKAAGINIGLEHVKSEIIVFADARQEFEIDTVQKLARHFYDSNIGAVSGHLMFRNNNSDTSAPASIGLYWRYETWLRINEAKYDSVIGCPGSVYAVKRECVKAPPRGLILDDLWIPIQVVMKGKKVAYDPTAIAWDNAEQEYAKEHKRKIRTLAGNYQLIFSDPKIVSPFHNRLWWMFISHKLLRLIVPFALFSALVSNIMLYDYSIFYTTSFYIQLLFYASAVAGGLIQNKTIAVTCRLCNFTYFFVNLNWAAVSGLYYILLKKENSLWNKAK